MPQIKRKLGKKLKKSRKPQRIIKSHESVKEENSLNCVLNFLNEEAVENFGPIIGLYQKNLIEKPTPFKNIDELSQFVGPKVFNKLMKILCVEQMEARKAERKNLQARRSKLLKEIWSCINLTSEEAPKVERKPLIRKKVGSQLQNYASQRSKTEDGSSIENLVVPQVRTQSKRKTKPENNSCNKRQLNSRARSSSRGKSKLRRGPQVRNCKNQSKVHYKRTNKRPGDMLIPKNPKRRILKRKITAKRRTKVGVP